MNYIEQIFFYKLYLRSGYHKTRICHEHIHQAFTNFSNVLQAYKCSCLFSIIKEHFLNIVKKTICLLNFLGAKYFLYYFVVFTSIGILLLWHAQVFNQICRKYITSGILRKWNSFQDPF